MIQNRSMLDVADNSGAKKVQCIRVMGGANKRYASLGDTVIVAIKEAAPDGTVKKGEVARAVVVAVQRLVRHDMYRKTIKRTSTFMAHDEKGAKQGDRVRIVETRPLSRNKRWRVEEILSKGLAEDVAGTVA